jgi:hypothetical protein
MLITSSLNRRPARTVRIRPGAAALAIGGAMLAGGLFLAGCSGAASSSGTASSSGMAAFPPAPGAARAAAPGAALAAPAASAAAGSAAKSSGAGTTARLAPASDIIYTAQLTVRAASVGTAAARAAQIAEGAGGYVSNESTSADPDHPSQATATVQLKIPVASYPATLGQLASSLGTQLSLQEQTQDVTEQVADVNSQVTSFQAAIAQLRALLSHAGSVGDLLNVQNQINDEESALEALQAQQRALSHETSYATVALTILGPKAKPVVHHPKAPPSLAGGLGTGWHALRVTVSWVLASLGVVVPFAAVAALAGFVLYQGRRWLLRRRPAARPASPENEKGTGNPQDRAVSGSGRIDSACTRSVSLASTPGSVSGSTPWPRLKTCPSAVRPRTRTSLARSSMTSQGASRTAGSRLPCRALPGSTRRAASSSGVRQSTPTTSAPASPISPSSSPVPTPK